MNWSMKDCLPWKGKDTLFDQLLDNLGILSNRRYASHRWLQFKKSKGIFPPPKFEFNGDLIDALVAACDPKATVQAAIQKTAKQLNGSKYESCLVLAQNEVVTKYLCDKVTRFAVEMNHVLCPCGTQECKEL